MRQQHDAAHRIAIRILGLIAPCLREEEQRDFYQEAMPAILAEIEDYDRRRRLEDAHLRGGAEA